MPTFDLYLVWLLGPIYLGFAVASFFLAQMVTQKLKRKRLISILAALFLPLPLMLVANETWPRASAEVAWRYYEHLCSTYAGDKIYRTVDEVPGIFQMRLKNPRDYTMTNERWGMEDPYGYAAGNSFHGVRVLVETGRSRRYQFLETPLHYGSEASPPYMHYDVVPTGKWVPVESAAGDKRVKYRFELRAREVQDLKSRYGFAWEDLTTLPLRLMWISGGRILIKEIQTGEVLAQRTGFNFARYRNGARDIHFWANRSNMCPAGPKEIWDFIPQVLKPPREWIELGKQNEEGVALIPQPSK